MKREKTFRIIKLITAAVLWIFIIVLIIEVKFKLNSEYKVSGIVYDKELGWRYKNKLRYKKTGKDNEYRFSTNNRGFRDREHSFLKGKNTKRIVLLGDSYTVGTRISDEKIFTGLFEKMINKNGGIKYDVMNAAVSAWGSDQQFLYLRQEGIRYEPDYVFLMIAPNDVRETYVKGFFYLDDKNSLRRNKPSLPLKARFFWFLANHSSVYQFLQQKIFKTEYGNFSNIFECFPVWFDVPDAPSDHALFLKETPQKVKEAHSLFKMILLEMNRVCIENDCKLILVILPTKMEFDGQLGTALYQPGKIGRYVENIAIENNISFLDLYSALEKEQNPLKMFISDEYHLDAPGHAFIASRLYEFFEHNKGDEYIF